MRQYPLGLEDWPATPQSHHLNGIHIEHTYALFVDHHHDPLWQSQAIPEDRPDDLRGLLAWAWPSSQTGGPSYEEKRAIWSGQRLNADELAAELEGTVASVGVDRSDSPNPHIDGPRVTFDLFESQVGGEHGSFVEVFSVGYARVYVIRLPDLDLRAQPDPGGTWTQFGFFLEDLQPPQMRDRATIWDGTPLLSLGDVGRGSMRYPSPTTPPMARTGAFASYVKRIVSAYTTADGTTAGVLSQYPTALPQYS